MYRQGDLLFTKCDAIPKTSKIKTDGVIAFGAATGHKHAVKGANGKVYIDGSIVFIKSNSSCPIVHDEHKTIILPKGIWLVKRQREYTPAGWIQVAD